VEAEGILLGERVWFHDTRSPARRMGVSTHPYDATVVISFWQGDACTGTFRLPVAESARLISTLAYGMAEGLPEDGTPRPGATSGARRWLRELLARFGRTPPPPGGHLRLLK
jgi:hypothetical protein